jgi:hypothetical protein
LISTAAADLFLLNLDTVRGNRYFANTIDHDLSGEYISLSFYSGRRERELSAPSL